MDLFDALSGEPGQPRDADDEGRAPLAVRMRPRTLADVLGQGHLLQPGSPLRRLVEPASAGPTAPASVLLWGPPGTGKTTLAYLIAGAVGRHFVELSAVSAGVKDVRAVVTEARHRLAMSGTETVLFIDEVHRFTTTQQDALLPSVENRWVTLVAATTENPFFAINSPLLSRSILLTLKPLTDDDIGTLVDRALVDARGLDGAVTLLPEGREQLVRLAGGDARRALTVLEAAAAAALSSGPAPVDADRPAVPIAAETIEAAVDRVAVRYDRAGDQHYDVTSAFIKSMRGSDVDAALHYLARMIVAGEDPRFIARRIMIAAAEEVGMADPSAMRTAVAAAQAVALIGWPEAQLVLANAVVHIATAPKSNAVTEAIGAAVADVRAGRGGVVPAHLRDGHYSGAERLGHAQGYRYAHEWPHAVAPQQYAPDELVGVDYYHPSDRGQERDVAARLGKIRGILRSQMPPGGRGGGADGEHGDGS